MKTTKIVAALCLMGLGAGALWGSQWIMHKTSTPEFCVSCHSMDYPRQEWEGSKHFANAKGIRAECVDCHIPQEGWHYVKAKFIALKDLYFEAVGKLDSKEKYEQHRAELAQAVWDDLKATDSETCRSCHSFDAMNCHSKPNWPNKCILKLMPTNKPVLIATKASLTSYL